MIYLVYSPEFSPLEGEIVRVKIGVSVNPQDRLEKLQIGSPVKLELLKSYELQDYVEGLLHKFLKEHRVRGEWFDLPNEILNKMLECTSDDMKDWLHDDILEISLRKAGKLCLTPAQCEWFYKFLDHYKDLEEKREIVVSIGYLSNVWSNKTPTECEKRILSLAKKLGDFLVIELVTQRDPVSAQRDYKIQWFPDYRGKKNLDQVYDSMFGHINSPPDLLEEIKGFLTESQFVKVKYLIQGFPQLLSNGEIIKSTTEIKDRIPNMRSNQVFPDLQRIANKIPLFTIEKVLVDVNGKVIDDVFGDEDKRVSRGGRPKTNTKNNIRYVRIVWKGKQK